MKYTIIAFVAALLFCNGPTENESQGLQGHWQTGSENSYSATQIDTQANVICTTHVYFNGLERIIIDDTSFSFTWYDDTSKARTCRNTVTGTGIYSSEFCFAQLKSGIWSSHKDSLSFYFKADTTIFDSTNYRYSVTNNTLTLYTENTSTIYNRF